MNLLWFLSTILLSIRVNSEELNARGSPGDGNYDPMTSNIDPQTFNQSSDIPYMITESRLTEIRRYFMYPYYDKGGDADSGDYQKDIQDSTSQIHKSLNFQLPFFGFRFNYTRVSLNGYLGFSDPPPNYRYPLVFPTKNWPEENDPAFIGIFYSKCKLGKLRDEDVDQRIPGAYFRIERDLRTRQDQMGVEIRERLKWDIRNEIIGSNTFDPKHAIIVTWKNVSFQGALESALYHTDTFQMVIATDEVYTYAMFNYLNINWTSQTEAGGDPNTGEGGIPAYVGFNAGNGTRSYEYLPYSQRSTIHNLTISGYADGFKGRHVFRIDEKIVTGSCVRNIVGSNLPLMLAPESGNMLGGTLVNITGPCFQPSDVIICKFGAAEVNGFVIDINRATCVQPQLFVEGYIRLEVTIGSNISKWTGLYYVESPATATQNIYFKDTNYLEKSPSSIEITWDKQNLSHNANANIQISLWGYKESTLKPTFTHIADIDKNAMNTGEYTIIPSNQTSNDSTDIKFGFIQLKLSSVNSSSATEYLTPAIWSRPIPLGWYFQFQWENMYGDSWPQHLCDDWLKTDRLLKNFTQELAQCPCTIQQALADKGRYMPDFDCDKDSNPRCYSNRGAIHCVKTGSPALDGTEEQCCYDKNGYLMLSYDQQWGSSPRRSHNLGQVPYNETGNVPTLSQWYNDIIPKHLCCLWQEEQAEGCEILRLERRPTQDCTTYQSPGVASVYGDPHIITFDGLEYSFNGKGEFVLVKSKNITDNLEVQGRFEQMDNNTYGEVKATQLTSIVARGNSSTVVEIRKRPLDSTWRYKLDVFANARRVYFDRPSLKFQHFPGVTIYTPTYISNQSQVIIMFDNGAGVEVLDDKGCMSARVYLPRSFINKTIGLFGNWSFNLLDDFTLPDGTQVGIVTNVNDMERVYYDFGSEWMVNDTLDPDKGHALFYREYGRSSATYNDKTFRPQFLMTPEDIIPANRSDEIEQTYQICNSEIYECYYDYAMSLNKDVAYYTMKEKRMIDDLKETVNTKVISCGALKTPTFGRKSTFLFIPGAVVHFECYVGFVLIGDSTRTCLPDGTWDIPDYGYTECIRQNQTYTV